MFTIKEIISANEIIVTPKWIWEGREGNRVWIDGYYAPKEGEPAFLFAKDKLESIIDKQPIQLKDPKYWSAYGYDILVCKIYKDDFNIAFLFPEFGGKLLPK